MLKPEMVLKFRNMFEMQKREVNARSIIDKGIVLQKEDMLDDVDMTSVEMETAMRTRLRNRETLYIKKVDEALTRISKGTFGTCEECEEEIELKRLEARPTATLCVSCKEAAEHREHTHIDGHRPKSLGKLRLA